MDLCRNKCLNPFLCAVIIDRELALKEDIADKLLATSKAVNIHHTHDIAGNIMDMIVLEYDKKDIYDQVFQHNDRVNLKLQDKSYNLDRVMVSSVMKPPEAKTIEERKKEVKESKVIPKNVRKVKVFSGVTPIPSGESNCDDWVDVAQDMIDYDIHLSSVELFYILRNSLYKNALTTVASSTSSNCSPQELVDTIKMTYGHSHSVQHLTYEFHKVEQLDLERPSALWTRLQNLGRQIKRQDPMFNLDMERFNQFKFALNSTDHELLDTHYGIESSYNDGNFPEFVDFLHKIQLFERDKRERLNRNKRSACRSALVTVDEGIKSPVTVSSITATPQAPAATAPPPQSTQEAEAGVMAFSMQGNDSHANHQKKHFEKQKKEKPKRIITCYNCDKEGHRYTDCPLEFNEKTFKINFDKAKQRRKEFEARKSGQHPN